MAQPVSRKLFPSVPNTNRRFKLGDPKQDHTTPEQRLAEHKASMASIGPDPGGTVRVTMRSKLGDERPTVRKMYDTTQRRKRGKGTPKAAGAARKAPSHRT